MDEKSDARSASGAESRTSEHNRGSISRGKSRRAKFRDRAQRKKQRRMSSTSTAGRRVGLGNLFTPMGSTTIGPGDGLLTSRSRPRRGSASSLTFEDGQGEEPPMVDSKAGAGATGNGGRRRGQRMSRGFDFSDNAVEEGLGSAVQLSRRNGSLTEMSS